MSNDSVIIFGDELGLTTIRQTLPKISPIAVVYSHKRSLARESALKWHEETGCSVIMQPPASNKEESSIFFRTIQDLHPRIGLCYSYDIIFKKEIIDIFTEGIFNVHGSLLPKYRGTNVINWVLINGEGETGVTLHKIVEQVDAGPIVCQKKVIIDFCDTALTLREKLKDMGQEVLSAGWEILTKQSAVLLEQDCHQATNVRRRKPEDGYFEWDWSCLKIYNLIRGLVSPWPGAWYIEGNKKIVIDYFMTFPQVQEMQKDKIGYIVQE
jgi:UDP-4-amino-4-deoxy-L-arabinose formyltransferase/UDP-glucuronic acid dehydrogenase (UDP-4-keto-hexauronic acid decarboxylating)